MGVVYEAEDLKLKRHVALKFLTEKLSKDRKSLERFKLEAQATSALNHPHICTIHDILYVDGYVCLVLELMEGLTLKHRINGKPMDINEVVEIGSQITDALNAAHKKGIIHRDIKPANIFVTDQAQAKLLDFGLAKLTLKDQEENSESTIGWNEQITETGVAIGTVAYMSPEQARGKLLDARSDLFSFSAVLYEMVTGEMPFNGQTTGEILEAIFTHQPAAVTSINANVPVELERIIGKGLEKDPNLRYQHASDFRSDLQRLQRDSRPRDAVSHKASRVKPSHRILFAIIAFVALTITALVLWRDRNPTRPSPSSRIGVERIAVLPFTNISPDRDQEYFTDGLTEELINTLAKNPRLRVTSRASVFAFKGKNIGIQTVAEKLSVTHVLDGSVRKLGNRLRINAELVEVSTDSHLWSQTYDRTLDDIFAVQDDIAKSVAEAMKVALLGEKKQSSSTTSSEAYTAYLQGRYFYNIRTKESLEKAIGYFEEALKLDPRYAPAWVGLGRSHWLYAINGYASMDEGYRKARAEYDKALQLDPNLTEAHAALASSQMIYERDWLGTERSLRKAMELEPENSYVLRIASNLEADLGRNDRALELARRSLALDPLSAASHYALSMHAYYAGQWQLAETEVQKTLELNPQHPAAQCHLGRIYLAQSKVPKAVKEFEKEKEPFWHLFGLTLSYHAAGKRKEAESSLRKIIEEYQDRRAFQIAEIYAYRQEIDRAFEWLDRAILQRGSGICDIKRDPLLRSLEKDPRYIALLTKLKLPLDSSPD